MADPHIEYVTLREHFEALREADQRALQIKEQADDRALLLAREIQTYKDEKANELREQINSERGQYATRDELGALEDKIAVQLKPVSDYISGRQGRAEGTVDMRAWVIFGIALIIAAQAFWSTH